MKQPTIDPGSYRPGNHAVRGVDGFRLVEDNPGPRGESVIRAKAHISHRLRAVRLSEGLGLRFVAHHFDVVPVRTNDESCIVVRVVARAQARRTIVFATRLQSRAIESFDLLAILGCERQVKMAGFSSVW